MTDANIPRGSARRQRLRDRRSSETFAVETQGLKFTATVSRFDNGRLAEIFLSNHKVGSQADCNARDAAVVCAAAETRAGRQPAEPRGADPCPRRIRSEPIAGLQVTYRTGRRADVLEIDEIADLHDSIERGPDWNEIDRIVVTFNRPRPRLTLLDAG